MSFVISTANKILANPYLYREYDLHFIRGCLIYIDLQDIPHFDLLIVNPVEYLPVQFFSRLFVLAGKTSIHVFYCLIL